MKTKGFVAFVFTIVFGLYAQAEKWILTILEWPPFTCEKCPEQGAGAKVLRDALKAEGIEIEFVFLPWTRAILESKQDKYIGYYPAWPEDVQEGFSPSISLYKSPLGFIEQKNKPLKWEKLSDLKGKTIGTVQDYGNTTEFNELIKSGVIKTEVVSSDDINVKKVAGGRMDGAIIDVNNAKWFLTTDLKAEADKVVINPKTIADKDLHIAFNGDSKSKAEKVKAAFAKINAQKIVDDYLKTHLK